MIKNRLAVMVLAIVFMMNCTSYSWAEEAASKQTEPDGGSVAAAVVSDIIYIPGKAGTCALSGAFWTVAMVLTGGVIYKEAGCFVHSACTGKWVITGADMATPMEKSDI